MWLLIIVAYYFVGMCFSAWMVKSKTIRPGCTRCSNGDWIIDQSDGEQEFFAYFLVPIGWPYLILWQIGKILVKTHVIIHTVLVHATKVLNMRITKEGEETVIRFHVPKRSEM